MEVIHFVKYIEGILVNSWLADDYFKDERTAEKWLIRYRDENGNSYKKDGLLNNIYTYKNGTIKIVAEIKFLYEYLE